MKSKSLYHLDHAKSKHKTMPVPAEEVYKGPKPITETEFKKTLKKQAK